MQEALDGRGQYREHQVLLSMFLLGCLCQPRLPDGENERNRAKEKQQFRSYEIAGEVHHGIIPVKYRKGQECE